MPLIQTKPLKKLISDAVAIVEGLAKQKLHSATGAVIRAFIHAASVNDSFIQAQVKRVGLNSRLQTSDDDGVDSFVLQFSPPFEPRIQASKASTYPAIPTSLSSDVPAGMDFLRVYSVQGLAPTQALKLSKGTKTATCTVTSIQPTRTLTAAATDGTPGATTSNNATLLDVDSTEGMFVGGTLLLSDGGYSVRTTITAINSATEVAVNAISASIPHLYDVGTVVTLVNVLEVADFVLGATTLVSDLTVSSRVRATTLIEGVRFYRNQASDSKPEIAVGFVVQTRDGSVEYVVVADTSNPDFDVAKNAYVMPANATEVYVKAEAKVAGTDGHVLADKLVVMPTPISGVDGCTNPYGVQNAADRETNTQVIERFRDFIAGLNGPNRRGIEAAIASTQAGIQYEVLENIAADGITPEAGNILVIVSDANGVLGTELYDAVKAAMETARGLTTTYNIVGPTLIVPTIEMVLAYKEEYVEQEVKAAVATAIFNSFAGKGNEAELVFWSLVHLAMDTPGVDDVLSCTVTIGDDPAYGFDKTSGSYLTVGDGPQNKAPSTTLELIRPAMATIVIG